LGKLWCGAVRARWCGAGVGSPSLPTPPALVSTGCDIPVCCVCCVRVKASSLVGGCGFVPFRFWCVGSCGVVGMGVGAGADSPSLLTLPALIPTGWDKPEVSVCCGWGLASSLGGGCGFVPFGCDAAKPSGATLNGSKPGGIAACGARTAQLFTTFTG
jgi:hypothetical protein